MKLELFTHMPVYKQSFLLGRIIFDMAHFNILKRIQLIFYETLSHRRRDLTMTKYQFY